MNLQSFPLASNIQNDAVMWLDGIPDDWSARVHGSGLQQKFGDSFMRKCLNVITLHLFSEDSVVRELSWIEVATWFYLELDEWLVPLKAAGWNRQQALLHLRLSQQ